jgi:hypothetical protein
MLSAFSPEDFKYIQAEIHPFIRPLAVYCVTDSLIFGVTLEPSQDTTRRHVSEEINLHSDRCKNLKFLILRSFKAPVSNTKFAGYIINVQ